MDLMEARDADHCLLFTHHPVPQKKNLTKDSPPPSPQLIERLKARSISVFSYHIPLDRVSPWSPGTNLAKVLGLTPYEEFYEQNLVRMGLLCHSPYQTLSQLARAAEQAFGHGVKVYPYGGEELRDGRVAVMGGGASNPKIYAELREKGINAFLTGMTCVQTRILLECGNAQLTAAAGDALEAREITVLPDLVATAGGVIVDYFERVQNVQSLIWEQYEVDRMMKNIILKTFDQVWEAAVRRGISLRMASYVIALEKVCDAKRIRGIFP